jgi:hypothetical protein
MSKQNDYYCSIRTRGGVDGYCYHEGVLKKVVPWIPDLRRQGIPCLLIEDGAPLHKLCIANDYLTIEKVEKIAWLDYSPDVNASEHGWPILHRARSRGSMDTGMEKSKY